MSKTITIKIKTPRVTKAVKNALAIIEDFKTRSDEFTMLKGVLCANHSMSFAHGAAFKKLICTVTIARRMDAILKGESK